MLLHRPMTPAGACPGQLLRAPCATLAPIVGHLLAVAALATATGAMAAEPTEPTVAQPAESSAAESAAPAPDPVSAEVDARATPGAGSEPPTRSAPHAPAGPAAGVGAEGEDTTGGPSLPGDDSASSGEAAEQPGPSPMVWAGSIGIATAVGAAGAASGLLLAASATDDSTAQWTSIGLYIGAGVALVVGASLVIVGATAEPPSSDSSEPQAPEPTLEVTPTTGGLLLHGRF